MAVHESVYRTSLAFHGANGRVLPADDAEGEPEPDGMDYSIPVGNHREIHRFSRSAKLPPVVGHTPTHPRGPLEAPDVATSGVYIPLGTASSEDNRGLAGVGWNGCAREWVEEGIGWVLEELRQSSLEAQDVLNLTPEDH